MGLSMKAAALFSGGKDSLYAVDIVQKQGIIINNLITLLPTLPWPSPHAKNIDALKILAENMEKRLIIVDFEIKDALQKELENLDIDALVAGDVNVEAHKLGLQDLCDKVGIKLLEPLYGKNTTKLFHEIFNSGFKAIITGVNLEFLDEKWLGFLISKDTSKNFIYEIGSVDPLGENGEFHTLVLECPLFKKSFRIISKVKRVNKKIAYLTVCVN